MNRQIIVEQTNLIKPRSLNPEEIEFYTGFQDFLRFIHFWFYEKTIKNYRDYKTFRRQILKYSHKPYVRIFLDEIKIKDQQLIDLMNGKRKMKWHRSEYIDFVDNAVHIFRSKNTDGFSELMAQLKKYNNTASNSSHNLDTVAKTVRNVYHIQDPLFFVPNTFIRCFTETDMKSIFGKDLSFYKYTYLTLPDTRKDDFEYIVYFLQELQDSQKPVNLTSRQMSKRLRFLYDTPEFRTLESLISQYLSSNDKSLIPEILKKLGDFPEINQNNDERKKTIKIVYRGIGPTEGLENQADMIAYDRKQRFVATSVDKHVATKFAMRIGHLESDESRRNEEGYVLTYKVSPDSIILDTRVLQGIFNEDEVLIDATKAQVIDFQIV